jgi:hypothetical protein
MFEHFLFNRTKVVLLSHTLLSRKYYIPEVTVVRHCKELDLFKNKDHSKHLQVE